jgi:acetoin utilization deacetylase AcuC-like enzyme
MRSVVWSPRYACDIGSHVFPTRKYQLVLEHLTARGEVAPAQVHEPEPVPRELLQLVHTPAYMNDFFGLRPTSRVLLSELPITAAIRDAAVLAAGGTLLAARAALRDGAAMHLGGGFHHAMPDHAEGFCYLNDIAVALRILQHERVLSRAAVIDTDVHQGNGTARIFQDDPSVFTFSIHQENNYPVKETSDWDIGLDNGTGDDTYLELLAEAVPRVLERSRPEIVLMVAGADPYREDQLGGLGLTLEGLWRRDQLVVEECARRGVPVVGLLAGGYARRVEDTIRIHAATARAVLAWDGPPTQVATSSRQD